MPKAIYAQRARKTTKAKRDTIYCPKGSFVPFGPPLGRAHNILPKGLPLAALWAYIASCYALYCPKGPTEDDRAYCTFRCSRQSRRRNILRRPLGPFGHILLSAKPTTQSVTLLSRIARRHLKPVVGNILPLQLLLILQYARSHNVFGFADEAHNPFRQRSPKGR